MQKTNTEIQASTTRTGTLQFLVKGKPEDNQRASRELWSQIAVKITISVHVPVSTRRFIIGTKGKILNAISEMSGASIQLPKRKEGESEGQEDTDDWENQEAIEIKIVGDVFGVQIAKGEIKKIVDEKTSKQTVRISHIPVIHYPFIAGAYGSNVQRMSAEYGTRIHIPPVAAAAELEGETQRVDPTIIISGDREQVRKVVEEIESKYEELQRTCRELIVQIPKRQQKYLIGPKGAHLHEILENTGCFVELAPAADPSEAVTIRGPSENHIKALTAVMEKANSMQVESIDFAAVHHNASDPLEHARNVLRYLLNRQKIRKVEQESGIHVIIPRGAQLDTSVVVEFVGKERVAVEKARKEVLEMVKALSPSRICEVSIPSHLHRHIIGRKGQSLQKIKEQYGVEVLMADERDESDEVMIVYEGTTGDLVTLKDSPAERKLVKDTLEAVQNEMNRIAQEYADYTTKVLAIPAKYHRFVIGPKGSVLSNIVGGPESPVSVKVGSQKKPESGSSTENVSQKPRSEVHPDSIVVKGPGNEVQRVVSEIEKIIEDVKHNEVMNSFSAECKIPSTVLSHIIGKGGSNIARLKEELNVSIEFDEASKAAPAKPGEMATCTIIGGKKAIETAKARIIDLAEKMADETVINLSIPHNLHRSLIGASGRYVLRLQNKYGVYIQFPRAPKEGGENGEDDSSSQELDMDKVAIKGGKKGVAAAKQELLELMEYELEHNNVITFTIPARHLPHVVGRSGAKINEIKDELGVKIDLGRPDEDDTNLDAAVSVRIEGTKTAIQKAKNSILAVTADQDSTTSTSIRIEPKYHRYLIGTAGSHIRDIVTQCATETGCNVQSANVRFPRAGTTGQDADEVIVKGEAPLVEKIIEELMKEVQEQQNQVIVTVPVPVVDLSSIIGRKWTAVKEMQTKYSVSIQIPKQKSENQAPIEGETVLIKITGSSSNCALAKADLESKCRVSRQISVPKKHHRALVGNGGQTIMKLRSQFNVTVDHPPAPEKTTPTVGAETGGKRIDEEDDDEKETDQQPDIVWILRGDEESVTKAEKFLIKELTDIKSRTHTETVQVPQSLHRIIIGRGGRRVKEIRDTTGCQVDVPRSKDSESVILTGTEAGVKAAKAMILEIVERGEERQ